MNAMNQMRAVPHTFHKPITRLVALALGLGLFAGAGNSQAAVFNWTNTTSDVWQDPNAWNPVGVPGVSDTATFSAAITHSVSLTSDVTTLVMDVTVPSSTSSHTLTVDLGGNSLSLMQPGSSSPTALFWGDANGTSIVYLASSTGAGKGLFVTNAASLRATIGRSGRGIVFVTNGFVQVGQGGVANNALVLGNNAGPAARGTLVVSGPNTVWSNNASASIGNNGGAFQNSITLSNSATWYQVSNAFSVAANTTSSNNFFVMDSNARMFVSGPNSSAAIGGTAGAVGNQATIQGGAVWDNGSRALAIGNSTGISNMLTIGDSGQIVNVGTMGVYAGNYLVISNGFLQVGLPNILTNTSGTIRGYGSIASRVLSAGTGTITLGFGNSVGTLTISNDLTLVSGSTTILKLDKGQTGSNDVLNVSSNLTEDGTVTINNVGAALVGGDNFKLLNFGSVSGNFASTNLPSLTGPLVWVTTQLGSSGIISVVYPPSVTGPSDLATNVGFDVTISTTVTGVPVPSLQWQKGGVNVTDGANAWGSTNSGSTTANLTISNAQTNDSGTYCLIASNTGGAVTNCMTLTVAAGNAAPTITGPTDQNTILHSNATFTASVAGIPAPTVQWQENGVDIPGATTTSVTITNVSFAQDGFVYSIIASNSVGSATNSALLHVVVPPEIQTQPVSVTVTQTATACFSVLSTNGVPPPTYQWYYNNNPIALATNSTYCIASAVPTNMGTYKVVVANVAGSITSSNATLTVNSTMSAVVTPATNATGVCYDTPLYMAFDRTPVEKFVGTIKIFISTNTVTPVETIDTSLGLLQARAVAGDGNGPFQLYPIIIATNVVAIYPRLGVLTSNQTYYVTVDPGTFAETNGALFAGITDTNTWRFTTKPTGPANPHNVVVAYDNSGDFCTVQGALDSLPTGNTTYTLVNIRNGTYTEFVNTRNKNNVTFRGQSRTGTIVQYLNNNNNNGGTHTRMAFKIFSNDISIENMTVANTTPQGGSQAEALMLDSPAARFILYNADVNSRQDTLLANTFTSQGYFSKSLFRGNFDYIWGGGNLFFTNCEMRTIPTASNYNLTAARTENGPNPPGWQGPDGRYASNGFSIVDCRLTIQDATVSNVTVAGSNGTPDGNVAFISCHIDPAYIHPTPAVTNAYILWEYNNSNLTDTAAISLGLVVLTNGDARLTCASDVNCWLGGWVPQLAINILSAPTNLTVNSGQAAAFSVSATGIPDPSYQWLKAGTNLVGQTSATLNIPATVADDAGTYAVIVANTSGAVTNSAILTVIPTPFEAWQQLYFGCTSCPQAAANADPDGDGLSNQAEFLAGTDPTSSASGLRITSTVKQGSDVTITWTTAGGRTNVVQATAGDGSGGYSTNGFADISGLIAIPGSGGATTNYNDVGGATNAPSRYYRIRLAP